MLHVKNTNIEEPFFPVLYHATSTLALEDIRKEGLKAVSNRDMKQVRDELYAAFAAKNLLEPIAETGDELSAAFVVKFSETLIPSGIAMKKKEFLEKAVQKFRYLYHEDGVEKSNFSYGKLFFTACLPKALNYQYETMTGIDENDKKKPRCLVGEYRSLLVDIYRIYRHLTGELLKFSRPEYDKIIFDIYDPETDWLKAELKPVFLIVKNVPVSMLVVEGEKPVHRAFQIQEGVLMRFGMKWASLNTFEDFIGMSPQESVYYTGDSIPFQNLIVLIGDNATEERLKEETRKIIENL